MSHVHFLLPGISDTPVGGYRVVYAYANWIAQQGGAVTIWHSRAFFAETIEGRFRRLRRVVKYAKSVLRRLHRVVRRNPERVSWYPVDPAVNLRFTALLPRIRVDAGDVIIGTAVETMPFAARRAAGRARSVAFIQHFETWAADTEFIRRAWSAVDVRVVIAPWLAEMCAEWGLPSLLVPNAIDPDEFPPGPPLVEREPSVVTLISPHGYKRSDVAMSVFATIASARPSVKLRAFGQFPRPAELPTSASYEQAPPADMLARLYQSSTVYLCTSDAEGWHLPPAEASLSGATVVSTRIGGVEASMGADARYADPGDAAALALTVIEALDDLARSQELADAAQRRLRERTPDVSAGEFARAIGISLTGVDVVPD